MGGWACGRARVRACARARPPPTHVSARTQQVGLQAGCPDARTRAHACVRAHRWVGMRVSGRACVCVGGRVGVRACVRARARAPTRPLAHLPTHTLARTHARLHARTYAHPPTRTHTCTHTRTHARTHEHTWTHACTHHAVRHAGRPAGRLAGKLVDMQAKRVGGAGRKAGREKKLWRAT